MRERKQRRAQIGGCWLSKRRNSSVWCRTWFDPETRQTRRASLGTTDFQQAELQLIKWVVVNAEKRDQNSEYVLLEELLIRYYEHHARGQPSAEQARYALAKWSDFFAGATLSDLTPDRQEAFVDHLRKTGSSDGYIARILSIGRAALNRAYRRQEIKSVPFIMSVPSGCPRERRLTLQESAALFDAIAEEHLFMYCMVAFNTLARPEAILELRRFQISLENRLIEFNPPGRKQTKKYRPVVPITDTLLPWLERVKTSNVVSYSKQNRQVRSVKTTFRRTVARAGLSADVTPYTVRHTMATELRKRGVPPWEVSGMLGHKSGGYATTEIYAKYDPDFMGKAVAAIDGYFRDLQSRVNRRLILSRELENPGLRVSCVLVPDSAKVQVTDLLVEPGGIEPPTSTMPL